MVKSKKRIRFDLWLTKENYEKLQYASKISNRPKSQIINLIISEKLENKKETLQKRIRELAKEINTLQQQLKDLED